MNLLKIAITADPEIPVPPMLYGGIERIIFGLVEAYVSYGHEVHLFANPGSQSSAILHPWEGTSSSSKIDTFKNIYQLQKANRDHRFDIIHSFSRLAYLLFTLPLSVPKIMSYQREPTLKQISLANRLAKKGSLYFTGCSEYISKQILPFAPVQAIHNFVDTSFYPFNSILQPDAPLIFLGRIEPIKGTKEAIQIALKTNKKLIIAGNVPNEYQSYFSQEIEPQLNAQIKYIGPVNDVQKRSLLESALALLMPIQWNEPFGIVMIEAMACGTPVIGLNRGSVPEVISEGVNGYRCNTIEEMVEAVNKIEHIDRLSVRNYCEKHFSKEVIVERYLTLYRKLLNI